MADDPTWDFQNPASKSRLLSVLRSETDEMFELAADPTYWHAPTACPGWEFRDMIGHLLDATESYLAGFDIARHGGAAPESVGVTGMARRLMKPPERSDRYRVPNSSRGTATRPTD